MSLWVVSTALTLAVGWSGQQLASGEAMALRKVEPSIVRVMSGTQVSGVGVLVDPAGYFLAHRSAVSGPVLFGKFSSGEIVQLSVASVDDVTQLALLRAEGWRAVNRDAASVQAPQSDYVQKASIRNATRVLIVLADRTTRGDLTSSNLVGVMAPSRRGLTLSEIRFEDPQTAVGGGLAFTLDGRLVGVLGAALDSPAAQSPSAEMRGLPDLLNSGVGGGGGGLGANRTKAAFGPSTMTVAYSISPDILERVVAGFRSSSRVPQHPALGLMCRDAAGQGALIDSVRDGSTAAQAGIKTGDVVVELAGNPIRNQVDYTRVLIKLKVGDTVHVLLRRGQEMIALDVKVGS